MREEYPRPELEREHYLCLNGEWDFTFDFGVSKQQNLKDLTFDKKINVPFCPESSLSGICYKDFINGCVYRKFVNLQKKDGKAVLLHFEAVFYQADVYFNGTHCFTHKGGYTPFTIDVSNLVVNGDNEIILFAKGDSRNGLQPSGKQCSTLKSEGCFYTRCTGIWQTVWIEEVCKTHLVNYKCTGDILNNCTYIDLTLSDDNAKKVIVQAFLEDELVGKEEINCGSRKEKIRLGLTKTALWNTQTPTLYKLKFTVISQDGVDQAKGYFALREVSLTKSGLLLNGEKFFMRLVLDQGYYKDGVYTAPTDQDLMNDILISKRLGFNGARLHQKVFDRRFLYYADKLGYVVWGEYASCGFDFTRADAIQNFLPEWTEVLNRDFNHPSIIVWCPFNETWEFNKQRQNDGLIEQIYSITKQLDTTRPVVDTSGGYHVKTDIFDVHCYEQRIKEFNELFSTFKEQPFLPFKSQEKYNGEPYVLSEYGGFKWPVSNDGWGYGDAPTTEEEFVCRYVSFVKSILSNGKICGLCYTQLYDVEQEQNGIYYFDRTPKFSDEVLDAFRVEMQKISAFEKED